MQPRRAGPCRPGTESRRYARYKDSAGLWSTANITATITQDTTCNSFPVRIASTPPVCYSTIQVAYNDAPDGAVIQTKNETYHETDITITIDRPVNITIEGGYNSDYTSIVGTTNLSGMIETTSTGGILTLKNFILQ